MVKLEDFKVAEIKKMISKYNKEVKITTSGLKKADLIKKIREHPRLTVTESDKGVSIKVNSQATMGGKKIKIKKDKQSSKSKDDEKPEEKPKPKVPTITVTEEEKPKKKVIKRGGRYITVKPKEPKADLPPIPKPKARREAKKYDFNFMKKIKFSNDSSKNDRLAENAIRKNFNKKDIIKLCDTLYHNKNSKEFFKMTQNLEDESYEALVESIILEICEEYHFEEKKDLEKDTNEFYLDKFNRLIKTEQFKKKTKGIQEEDLRDLVSKMINPNRYTTIGEANARKKKLNKAYTTIKNYINNLKSKSPAPKKKEKKEPKKENTKDFIKSEFTKIKPSFKEDTVESLTKAIEHQKKQGNDEIVEKLQKDLKKLKGKGKAEEKPVEQPKDSFSIGKFPFKIKVDDKNIILKKNTPKQNKEDEKILRNRTDNMKRKITMKVGMTLMKLMKITDPKKIREEENNIVADFSILTTNEENRIVRQFSLMKYKNLQDKKEVYKFPRTAVLDTLALL